MHMVICMYIKSRVKYDFDEESVGLDLFSDLSSLANCSLAPSLSLLTSLFSQRLTHLESTLTSLSLSTQPPNNQLAELLASQGELQVLVLVLGCMITCPPRGQSQLEPSQHLPHVISSAQNQQMNLLIELFNFPLHLIYLLTTCLSDPSLASMVSPGLHRTALWYYNNNP